MENIAVKLKGHDHWIWFKKKSVDESGFRFIGKNGWGKNGTSTNIDVPNTLIEGRMESDSLNY